MSIREKLTEIFENARGEYISGEDIAKKLGCTRAAVGKAVKQLRNDGYRITAVTNKGYCLEAGSDVLSSAGVQKYIKDPSEVDIRVYKSVDSTNNVLRELANSGAPEGTIVISGEQTGGKGRLGRSFFSPGDTGLYMSLLLRPEMSAANAVRITTAAAVAVAEAVEAVSQKRADIKWVNDVYIGGRKICGILTEAVFSLENGGVDYAVLGIGVNVYAPVGGFPEDMRATAGIVFDSPMNDMRNRLAGLIAENFMRYYRELDKSTFAQNYRQRLLWKGERINVINGAQSFQAVLEDADENCALIVRLDDGTRKVISSGEITIRKV